MVLRSNKSHCQQVEIRFRFFLLRQWRIVCVIEKWILRMRHEQTNENIWSFIQFNFWLIFVPTYLQSNLNRAECTFLFRFWWHWKGYHDNFGRRNQELHDKFRFSWTKRIQIQLILWFFRRSKIKRCRSPAPIHSVSDLMNPFVKIRLKSSEAWEKKRRKLKVPRNFLSFLGMK